MTYQHQQNQNWLNSSGKKYLSSEDDIPPWLGLPLTGNWRSYPQHEVVCEGCGAKSIIPISWGNDGTCHSCEVKRETARRLKMQDEEKQ
jgi:hypothetical protein